MEVLNVLSNYAEVGFGFLMRGSFIPGMTMMGVVATISMLTLLIGGSLLFLAYKVINDHDISMGWGKVYPFYSKNEDYQGGFGDFVGNCLFYSAAIPPIFSTIGVALEGIEFFIWCVSDFWVPFAIVGGIIGLVFVLRTLKRLTKVVKSHVLNKEIHNAGDLDPTGLAEKLTIDEKAALLILMEKMA